MYKITKRPHDTHDTMFNKDQVGTIAPLTEGFREIIRTVLYMYKIMKRPHDTMFNQEVSTIAPLTEGSREIIRTVLSASPTARNLDLCSPGETRPRAMHTTSEDISFRSVYSFSCPV